MADIVLVSPRFDASYWGMEHALSFLGKRSAMPIASLPLLAALTPPGHDVTLLDENVAPLDFDRLARADLVGLTGMIVQRKRMREIVTELKRRGVFTVVGGPWVTVQEDYFGDLPDAIFVGEAEETWPQFLHDWKQGRHLRRYEQAQKTDMTKVPTPRYDLVNLRDYLFGSVQFSRGCPFQCEFCDIIVTFGRRPRLKTSAQIVAELDALRAQKVRIVFIVDDNLIGNKKAVKVLIRDLIDYQYRHGFPFVFFTEASLDLAEDDELMRLMMDANIMSVFVGIESPNEESLKETKKYQNVRPAGGTIVERVHRIQRAGMEVWSGMILGFDNDKPNIFELQRRFIHEARIVTTMIGMLFAIPKTPLHARLAREGRLDAEDRPGYGVNIQPMNMTQDELRAGFAQLMHDLYEPKAYFARVEDLYLNSGMDPDAGLRKYWKHHRLAWLKTQSINFVTATGLLGRLLWNIPEASLRRTYLRAIWRVGRRRPSPSILLALAFKCSMHYHQHMMARRMTANAKPVNTFN
jgi:radical SAM superfamily enzyme YgiQ (UPF0313 family)